METEIQATTIDPLAKFRGLAPEPKVKMSDAAAAKLRAVNEAQRLDAAAEKKFAEQFALLPKDTWTIVQVLKRVYPGCELPFERMANKIRLGLRRGWKVTSVADLSLFATLTCDEAKMSDEKFVTMITDVFNNSPTVEDSYRGRCANQVCGKGRDSKGNRVRARVPNVGDFCCRECKTLVKEARRQSARVRPN